MENIVDRPSLNLGGNSTIYFIRHSNILTIPRQTRSKITDDLVISGYWTELEVAPYSISYTERERDDDEGVYVQCSLGFLVPQETAGKRAKLKALHEERLAFLVKDNSTGLVRLIGNREEYLTHSQDMDLGAAPADLNGVEVRVSGRLECGAVFYEGAIPVDPAAELETVHHNIGGAYDLKFLPHESLVSITDGDLYLTEDFKDLEVIPYSIRFREADDEDDEGVSSKVRLSFVIGQETSELNYKLQLLRSRKVIFLLKDLSTGQSRLIGNTEEYMKAERRFSTGRRPSDRNDVEMEFAGMMVDGVRFFDGEVITPALWVDENGFLIVDETLTPIEYE